MPPDVCLVSQVESQLPLTTAAGGFRVRKGSKRTKSSRSVDVVAVQLLRGSAALIVVVGLDMCLLVAL